MKVFFTQLSLNAYLKTGEHGKGQYVCLTAEDEGDIANKLNNLDFSTLTIVSNPIGE
ncbi:MAG TPA: hypothetical protein VK153_01180 [Candidatus Paceibacterota bacterium]|nr:hypothetical protein [Candidatus Paceibacterota bacterium]